MRRLIKAGPTGLSSGDLAAIEKINASTASAQLLVLLNSELISQTRDGKRMIYHANYTRFQHLISFLMEDCCQGSADD